MDPNRGILLGQGFQGLQWQRHAAPSPLSDVLRVHEWNYVRRLQVGEGAWSATIDPFRTAISDH